MSNDKEKPAGRPVPVTESWDEFFTRFDRKGVPDDYMTEADRNQGQNVDRSLFGKISTPSIEALAGAWAKVAAEAFFPAGFEGMPTPEVHQANAAIQAAIAEYIAATNDTRLFGFLHLLGHAALRMEQALWPADDQK